MKSRIVLTICVVLAICSSALAACTGSSPTWTSTPDQASVASCVSSASRGDTINVSAGSSTWSSLVTLSKGVKLIGAGSANVTITSAVATGASTFGMVIDIAPDATAITNSETIRVSGFTFDGNNAAPRLISVEGAASSGTKPYQNLIIDNNKFKNLSSGAGASNGAIYNDAGQVRGVIYNNTFDRADIILRCIGNDTTTEWENSAYNTLAYGTADNLYFEGNTIAWSSAYTSSDQNPGWIECGQGGRVVARFNTWDFSNLSGQQEFWDVHGFQNWNGTINSGQTGTMIVEYYDNTLTNGANTVFRLIDHRGSWLMMFDNSYSGASTPSIEINQYAAGDSGGSGCAADINPTPITYNPIVNNTYVFNNLVNGTQTPMNPGSPIGDGCGTGENGGGSAGLNGGWWTQHASFTGATGIGRGLLSGRPATCTTGVGYWATDQGEWNSTHAGNDGQFYKCTSTNTWTLYYVPYTYPHPLQGAATPVVAPAAPMFAESHGFLLPFLRWMR